jgi:peptide deformylase
MIKIVNPHKLISRKVLPGDFKKVEHDAFEMKHLCDGKRIVGLSHPQIDDVDPLRFFVCDNEIVINPEIVRHSNYTVPSREGCLTFPDRPIITHQRWRKMEVQYLSLVNGEIGTFQRSLNGLESFIWQHEIDHLNGKYCYDVE